MMNYENPEEHHELYLFEFKFLPSLFELYETRKNNPTLNFDESQLIDIEFLKKKYETKHIDWNQFKFEKKTLPNNAKEFIYNFGEPKNAPLCYFAIFYVDEENKIYEYITLEKTYISKKFPYVVCGQKGSQHKNYGLECPSDFETFEKVVQIIIDKKYQASVGFDSKNFTIKVQD